MLPQHVQYRYPREVPTRSARVFAGNLVPIDLLDPTAPAKLAQDLVDFSVACLRTGSFTRTHNECGLRAALEYFRRPWAERQKDVPPPELAFQVGLTPRGQEKTRQRYEDFEHLPPEHRPTRPRDGLAMSERLMFPVGHRPSDLEPRFQPLNMIHANPDGVKPFQRDLSICGNALIDVAWEVAELLEIGLCLERGALTDAIHGGPHLLAPNATHVDEGVEVGDVANEVHYDLNAWTVFGRANAPGLWVWIAQTKRVQFLSIPEDCVLMQAGKQLTWLTGGHLEHGLHEVVATEQMFDALTRSTPQGLPRVRVSPPLFVHVNSGFLMRPLAHFANEPFAHLYPPTLAGDYLIDELKAINLAQAA